MPRWDRFPSPAASIELARIDLTRGYRWLWTQDFWILFGIGAAAAYLFMAWLAFDLFREIGAALAAGDPVPSWVALAWSAVWLFVVAFALWTGFSSETDLDNGGHYLTIRPASDVVFAHLLAWTGKSFLYVIPPVFGAALGLTVGTGSAAPVGGVLAAGVIVTVTGVAIGYPIGLAIKGFVRRSVALTRYKSALGLLFGVTYFWLMFSGRWLDLIETLEPVLRTPPLSWLTDLALVTTPGAEIDLLGALGALVLVAGIIVVSALLSPSPARYAWSADRQRPEDDAPESVVSAPEHRIDAVLGAICRRPATRGVASTALLRAARAPQQLVFVAFPLVFAIPLVESVLTGGTVPWYLPWLVVWYGAWAGGTLIPLNPLGNQGATLPTLLTAPADGRSVVHGNVVAAMLPVAPVTALLAVVAGVLSGRPGPELVALGLASVAAVGLGAVLAVGFGSVFPRFDAIDLGTSTQAVPPSKLAYTGFSMVLSITVIAIAAVADDLALEITAFVLSEWLPGGMTATPDGLLPVWWAIIIFTVLSVPLAYRLGMRRIDAYRMD